MKGYDSLALLTSRYPELAILRRFGRSWLKCLLYRQAELSRLEGDVLFLEAKCHSDRGEKFSSSWNRLSDEAGNLDAAEYREKVMELQKGLQEYRQLAAPLVSMC